MTGVDRDPAEGFDTEPAGLPRWVWLLLLGLLVAAAVELELVFVALLHR